MEVIGHYVRMYQVMLLLDGNDFDPLIDGVQSTPYEPKEGMIYRFRNRGDQVKRTRYRTVRVEVDQEWGDTVSGVAWVYLQKLPN